LIRENIGNTLQYNTIDCSELHSGHLCDLSESLFENSDRLD
jgi:hypothetical protein